MIVKRGVLLQERGNCWLKLIDRWVGIPLTFLLGKTVVKKTFQGDFSSDSILRLALIKTAALGDTILLSAIVREIRQYYPRAIITLVCANNNQAAANLLDGVDFVHVVGLGSPLRSLFALRSLPRQDVVMDFGAWPRLNSLIAYCMQADYKVGFWRAGQYRHYVFHYSVCHRDDLHEMDNYRALLQPIGLHATGFLPRIAPPRDCCLANSANSIVLHPFPGGSGKEYKEWPLERWSELGKWLILQDRLVLISGGAEDRVRAEYLAEELRKIGGQAKSLAGKYSLGEMAGLLQQAQVVISVNTGIMHLAAAVGATVVALHGPTSLVRWRALGEKVIDLSASKPCAPCLSLGFEYGCTFGECMQTITVEQVIEAVRKIAKV